MRGSDREREARVLRRPGAPLLFYAGTVVCGWTAFNDSSPAVKTLAITTMYLFAWGAMQYNTVIRSRLRRIDPEGSTYGRHREDTRNRRRAEAHRRAVAAGTIDDPVAGVPGRTITRTASGLIESVGDTPIRAWKRYPIVWHNGRLYLVPANGLLGATSEAFDHGEWVEARCPSRMPGLPPPFSEQHSPISPDESCSCGFYAVSDPDNATYHGVLVEVELSGRVIVAERGYRAQFLRVAAIHPPHCWICQQPASALWLDGEGNELPPSWTGNFSARVRATCLEHAPSVPLQPMQALDVFDIPIAES